MSICAVFTQNAPGFMCPGKQDAEINQFVFNLTFVWLIESCSNHILFHDSHLGNISLSSYEAVKFLNYVNISLFKSTQIYNMNTWVDISCVISSG